MTHRLRLVATDLDGTLLTSDAAVSLRTRTALRRVGRWGVHHVIVTGRPASRCAPFFEALAYRGLAVCGHGAQIYDAARRRLLSTVTLDRHAAQAVVERLTARVGSVALAADTAEPDGEFITTGDFFRPEGRHAAPVRVVTAGEITARPLDKLLLRHPSLPDGDLLSAAAGCCPPGVRVVQAERGSVQVVPTGFDKATGLARVAATLGVASGHVVAFGDMPADAPMLAWAGYGVAMANAHPKLKAVADDIAPANDDDGVAQVLDRLIDQGCRVPYASTRGSSEPADR